jgi:hypothetical protein
MQAFRPLTQQEIDALKHQNCRADSWGNIQVHERFNVSSVSHTTFSGAIKLGFFTGEFEFFGGVKKPSGISYATLHNCEIGNNVYISQVKNYIANYNIEDDVLIEHIDSLATEGPSSFGNGVKVAALNEAGGREVPIFDKLSAHLAYILTLYRHRPVVISKINAMIDSYAKNKLSLTGRIGTHARITNCRGIHNVEIGPYAVIDGVYRLSNGTINSCKEDPVHFGQGVIAEDFIVSTGARITDGAVITQCFVGQGTHLGKQYSAENSLFFANCTGMHGEACSIFAAPYTVTHHKSTLLIAGYFSFANAGSGSNQSNHMYKLGPIHQGIVERGSKTTSDSYLLWPAKVGAFTLVMGRHYKNSDTSDLPFSYFIESNDESILVPGVNLRSVGTVRDAQKWPKRDIRKDPNKLDFIHFKLLSPYTVQKMLRGVEVLKTLKQTSGATSNFYSYQSSKIKNSSLNHGLTLYEMAINKFLGNTLINKIAHCKFSNFKELIHELKPESPYGSGEWLDLAGLFAPKSLVEDLLDGIESGRINSLDAMNEAFASMYHNYSTYEWTWTMEMICSWWGKKCDSLTVDDIIAMIETWKKSVVDLDHLLYEDARKEFNLIAKTGFGVDGNEEDKHRDFEMVRGEFEKNIFVRSIREHIANKSAISDGMIQKLKESAAR